MPELKSFETGSLANKDIPGSTIDVAKKNKVRMDYNTLDYSDVNRKKQFFGPGVAS